MGIPSTATLADFPAARRGMRNLGFRILNLFIGGFFAPPDSGVRLGLLAVSGLAVPSWPMADAALSLVAGFLLLDLLHYLVDRLGHAVPFFCRIHALHHSDPDIDVTTTVRHHPIEILFSSTTYWLAVFVLDVPAFAALSHGLAVFITAAVQHGNVRLPERLERYLQPMLVTTDLHRLHHSVSFGLANSNYGAVLPFWDRLFRHVPLHYTSAAGRHRFRGA
jgi:sterol desaturase/sphingolipid hydroxylase (fatty acid hydroxylase superfamily)